MIMILQFLAGMSLIVFVHELGHYMVAKAFGIRVKKFYLFFDIFGLRLYRKHKNGTELGIGWLPVGGYIQMAGILSKGDDDTDAQIPDNERFDTKPVWQRVLVMLGGIMMNLVFALLVFSLLSYIYGRNQLVGVGEAFTITPGKLGHQAGLRQGDKVMAINMDSTLYEDELFNTRLLKGNTVLSVIRKKGKEQVHLHISVAPGIMQQIADKGISQFFSIQAKYQLDSIFTNLDLRKIKNFKLAKIVAVGKDSVHSYEEFIIRLKKNEQQQLLLTVIHEGTTSIIPAHRDRDGHISFSMDDRLNPTRREQVSAIASISDGTGRVWNTIAANSQGLEQIVSGKINLKDGLSGPVKIAALFGNSFEALRFWNILAVLSIAIAVFNLLPLGILDGGAVLLLVYEQITKRPVDPNIKALFQLAGLIILIILMAFVLYNDIYALLIN